MTRMVGRMFVVLLLSMASLLAAQASRPAVDPAPVGQSPLEHTITIPLQDGKLSLLRLSRGLLGAYGIDVPIDVPDVAIDLGGMRGILAMQAVRTILAGSATVERSANGKGLEVRIDRQASRRLRHQVRKRLLGFVSQVTGRELLQRTYRLQLPEGDDKQQPLVVLVHGLDSNASILQPLRDYLVARGHRVASFDYPDDAPIDDSGVEFAGLLRQQGRRRIFVVAYSMGGLVARWAIESSAIDPGNVALLIQLGTPNQGSQLAYLRILLDAGYFFRRGADVEAWQSVLQDGAGEAGFDLRPGSTLLTRLNQLQRNRAVEYRHIVGTRAALDERQLDAWRKHITNWVAKEDWTGIAAPRLQSFLGDLDEVAHGKGDGAVAIKRAALKGVDLTFVDRSHLGLVRLQDPFGGAATTAADHPVFRQIEAWVAALATQPAKPGSAVAPRRR